MDMDKKRERPWTTRRVLFLMIVVVMLLAATCGGAMAAPTAVPDENGAYTVSNFADLKTAIESTPAATKIYLTENITMVGGSAANRITVPTSKLNLVIDGTAPGGTKKTLSLASTASTAANSRLDAISLATSTAAWNVTFQRIDLDVDNDYGIFSANGSDTNHKNVTITFDQVTGKGRSLVYAQYSKLVIRDTSFELEARGSKNATAIGYCNRLLIGGDVSIVRTATAAQSSTLALFQVDEGSGVSGSGDSADSRRMDIEAGASVFVDNKTSPAGSSNTGFFYNNTRGDNNNGPKFHVNDGATFTYYGNDQFYGRSGDYGMRHFIVHEKANVLIATETLYGTNNALIDIWDSGNGLFKVDKGASCYLMVKDAPSGGNERFALFISYGQVELNNPRRVVFYTGDSSAYPAFSWYGLTNNILTLRNMKGIRLYNTSAGAFNFDDRINSDLTAKYTTPDNPGKFWATQGDTTTYTDNTGFDLTGTIDRASPREYNANIFLEGISTNNYGTKGSPATNVAVPGARTSITTATASSNFNSDSMIFTQGNTFKSKLLQFDGNYSLEPTVKIAIEGMTALSGEGVPNSVINAKIPVGVGDERNFTTTVGADGKWTIELPTNPTTNRKYQLLRDTVITVTQREMVLGQLNDKSDELQVTVLRKTVGLHGNDLTKSYTGDELKASVNRNGIPAADFSIEEVKYVIFNDPGTVTPGEENFDTHYNSATSDRKGDLTSSMQQNPNPTGTENEYEAVVGQMDYNCKIWIRARIAVEGVNEPLYAYDEFTYGNLFTPYPVQVRGMINETDVPNPQLYNYETVSGTYGLPYHGDGQTVLINPTVPFDTVNLPIHSQFSSHWTAEIDSTAVTPSTPYPLAMNATFMSNTIADNAEKTQYTLLYNKIANMWATVPVKYASEQPLAYIGIHVTPSDEETEGTILVPLESAGSTATVTNFLEKGGRYTPPQDVVEADRQAIGWSTNSGLSTNFTPQADFSQNFNPYFYNVNTQHMTVYYKLGQFAINEKHIYQYNNVETELGYRNAVRDKSAPDPYASTAPAYANVVPIGYKYKIDKGGAPNDIEGTYTFVYESSMGDANLNQNGLISIDLNATQLTGAAAVEIVYYYVADTNNNGIPDSEENYVTVNWYGYRVLNNTVSNIALPIKDTQKIYSRVGETLKITNDGSANGDEDETYVLPPYHAYGGTWIFDKWYGGGQQPYVEVNYTAGDLGEKSFVYGYSTDGAELDNRQYVTERYYVLSESEDFNTGTGTQIAGEVDTQYYLLKGHSYNKAPKSFDDLLYVGYWITGNGTGDTKNETYVNGQAPANVSFTTEEYTPVLTYVYREKAEPVTVTWTGEIYYTGNTTTLGSLTKYGYLGEEVSFNYQDVAVDGFWTLKEPAATDLYYTLADTAQTSGEFRFIEKVEEGTITVIFKSDDDKVNFVRTDSKILTDPAYVVEAMAIPRYALDPDKGWDIADRGGIVFDAYDSGNPSSKIDEVEVDPARGTQTLTFYYKSQITSVQVLCYDVSAGYGESERLPLNSGTHSVENVMVGEPFSVQAPLIVVSDGVGTTYYQLAKNEDSTDQAYYKTIDAVQPGTNRVEFYYEPVDPNSLMILREGTATNPGNIIEYRKIEVGNGIEVPIPSLTDSYFTVVPGQTPEVFDNTSPEPITYYYTKDMMDVEVQAVEVDGTTPILDQNNDAIIKELTAAARKGEMYEAVADLRVEGHTLIDATTRLVYADPTLAKVEVPFKYSEDQLANVTIRYIYYEGNDPLTAPIELNTYTAKAIVGSKFTAQAIQYDGFVLDEVTPGGEIVVSDDPADNVITYTYLDQRKVVTAEFYLENDDDPPTYDKTADDDDYRVVEGDDVSVRAGFFNEYVLYQYQIDSEAAVTVGSSFVGMVSLTDVQANHVVKFYYKKLENVIEERAAYVRYVSWYNEDGSAGRDAAGADDFDASIIKTGLLAGNNFTLTPPNATDNAATHKGYLSITRTDAAGAPIMDSEITLTNGENIVYYRYDKIATQWIDIEVTAKYYDDATEAWEYIREKTPTQEGFYTKQVFSVLRGESFTAVAPIVEWHSLLGNSNTKTQIAETDPGVTTQEVYFEYYRVSENVLVQAVSVDDQQQITGVIAQRYYFLPTGTVQTFDPSIFGADETAGWKLDPAGQVHTDYEVVSNAEDNVLNFTYTANVRDIQIVVKDQSSSLEIPTHGIDLLMEDQPIGHTVTVFAPHVPGYALVGPSSVPVLVEEDVINNPALPQEVEFFYEKTEGIPQISVVGKHGNTELYRYVRYKLPDDASDTITIQPTPVMNYALPGAKQVTFGEDLECVFQYDLDMVTVTIEAVDAANPSVSVEGYTDKTYQVVKGMDYTALAPSIPGWVLDQTTPQDYEQTESNIQADKTFTFTYNRYEQQSDIILVKAVDDAYGPSGVDPDMAIRTLRTVPVDVSGLTDIDITAIPELYSGGQSAITGWKLVATEPTTQPVPADPSIDTVYFRFEKDMVDVTINYVDPHSGIIHSDTVEAQMGTAFTAGLKDFPGYTPAVGAPYYQTIMPTGNFDVITFHYDVSTNGQYNMRVVYRYVEADDTDPSNPDNNTQIYLLDYYETEVPTGVDESYSAYAHTFDGYRLIGDTLKTVDATNPATQYVIYFDYVRAAADVSVALIDYVSREVIYEYTESLPTGKASTVRAPSLSGYVPKGETSHYVAAPEKVTAPLEFYYSPIKDAIKDYLVTVTTIGKCDDVVLYTSPQTMTKGYGAYEVKATVLPGYKVDGTGIENIYVGDNNETVTFNYIDLNKYVTINLMHKISDTQKELIKSFQVSATAEAAFSYLAPDLRQEGYGLAAGEEAQKSLTSVALDGSSVIEFDYEKLTSNIQVVGYVGTGAGDPDRKVLYVENYPVPDPNVNTNPYTINFRDLTGSYYSYTGNVDSTTIDYVVGDTYTEEAYYTKDTATVNVTLTDENGTPLGAGIVDPNPIVYANQPKGEAFYVEAPNVSGYVLLEGENRMKSTIPTDNAASLELSFKYRDISDTEIVVKAVSDEDVILYSQTINGKRGEVITAQAPALTGWKLALGEDAQKQGTIGTDDEIVFEYVGNMAAITVKAVDANGSAPDNVLSSVANTYAVGLNATIYAPHVPGYVLTDANGASRTFAPVKSSDNGTEVVFAYKHITSVLNDYTVRVTTIGKCGEEELYRSSQMFAKGSGNHRVVATTLPGYKVLQNTSNSDVGFMDVDVQQDDITVTFNYVNLKTSVQVKLLEQIGATETQLIEAFYVDATAEEAFSYLAPDLSASGYGLVRGSQTVGTVDSVALDGSSTLEFVYEKLTSNIQVVGYVGTGAGDPDRKVLYVENYPVPDPNVNTNPYTINFRDLTGSYYSYTGNVDSTTIDYVVGDTYTEEAYYTKDTATVNVTLTDENGTPLGAGIVDPNPIVYANQPKGEAFYVEAPNVSGYVLLEGENRMKSTIPTDDPSSLELSFQYRSVAPTEIAVKAVTTGANPVILHNQVLTGATGDEVKVYAPSLTGWKLVAGELSEKTGVIGTDAEIVFEYEAYTAEITIEAVDVDTTPNQVIQTQPKTYPVGLSAEVYAPHIPGYILADENGAKRTYSPVEETGNAKAIFKYKHLSTVVDEYTTLVTIRGVCGAEELYSTNLRLKHNYGAYNANAMQMPGYRLDTVSPQVVNIGTQESAEVVFEYTNLSTYVNIKLTDEDTSEDLGSFKVEATVDQPFTYTAPDVEGYALSSDRVIGKVDAVEENGQSVIEFKYRELTSNVVLIGHEYVNGDEDDPVIRVWDIDTSTFQAGSPALVNWPALHGDDHYTANAPGSETIESYDSETQHRLHAYYTKELGTVTVRAWDIANLGTTLQETPYADCRLGEASYFEAPDVTGYYLLPNEPRMQGVIPVDDTSTVDFNYRAITENQLAVKAIGLKGGERITLQTQIVEGTTGELVKVSAPKISGWKLAAGEVSQKQGKIGAGAEIVFEYEEFMAEITVQALDIDKSAPDNVLKTITTKQPRGLNYTVYAPHVPGYVLVGNDEVALTPVSTDTSVNPVVTFNYRHLSTVVDDYTVLVTTIGKCGDVELYKNETRVRQGLGEYDVYATQMPGYQLDSTSPVKLNIANQASEVVEFEYIDLSTHVVIELIDKADGSILTSFSENATVGQPFTYRAPSWPGYVLDTAVSSIGKVDSVLAQGQSKIEFFYDKLNANVSVICHEGSDENDRVIRVLPAVDGELLEIQGDQATVTWPDLTALDYYDINQAAPGGDVGESTFTYNSSQTYTVHAYYTKQLVDVTVRMTDENGDLLTTGPDSVIVYPDNRKGEVAYFEAPDVTDYYLLDGEARMKGVIPYDNTATVDFKYRAIEDDEIVVKAVTEADAVTGYRTLLHSQLLTGIQGSKVTVSAPSLSGWKLKAIEPLQKTAEFGADKEVTFVYEPNVAEITIKMVSAIDDRPIAEDKVVTVPKGLPYTVYAPHVDGYILTSKTSSYPLEPVDDTNTASPFVFKYLTIYEAIDTYTASLDVVGMCGGLELYRNTLRFENNYGPYTAKATKMRGYQVQGTGEEQVTIGTGIQAPVIFQYDDLATYVTVKMVDVTTSTHQVLLSTQVEATAGQPFTYQAPYRDGYQLVVSDTDLTPSTDMIGTIATVAADGSSELPFYYKKIDTKVQVKAYEMVNGVEQVINYFEVDPSDITIDSGTASFDSPDLSAAYYEAAQAKGYIQNYDDTRDYTVPIEYTKQTMDVVVKAYDISSGAPIVPAAGYTLSDQRMGEAITVAAPFVTDYDLAATELITKQVVPVPTPDPDEYEVIFNYEQIGEDEVLVASYSNDADKTIIQTYTIKAVKGKELTIPAPTHLGWTLAADAPREVKVKVGTDKTAEFWYDKNVVSVTVRLVNYSDPTEILNENTVEVAKGGNSTFYAPQWVGWSFYTGDPLNQPIVKLTNVQDGQAPVIFKYAKEPERKVEFFLWDGSAAKGNVLLDHIVLADPDSQLRAGSHTYDKDDIIVLYGQNVDDGLEEVGYVFDESKYTDLTLRNDGSSYAINIYYNRLTVNVDVVAQDQNDQELYRKSMTVEYPVNEAHQFAAPTAADFADLANYRLETTTPQTVTFAYSKAGGDDNWINDTQEVVFKYSTSTKLTVKVLDPQGQPAVGATVTVSGAGLGVPMTQTVDAQGETVFNDLPYGSYSIKAEKTGLAAATATMALSTGNADQAVTLRLSTSNPPGPGVETVLEVEGIDSEGNQLFKNTRRDVLVGQEYTVDAPPYDGYWIRGANTVKIVIVKGKNLVTFYYEENDAGHHDQYINGYPGGEVRPSGNLTRAEAAAIMDRTLAEQSELNGSVSFPDVATTDWYYDEVMLLAEQGIIEGYVDGTFRPEDTITRAEFVAMVTRFYEIGSPSQSIQFSDLSSDHWGFSNINYAVNQGWIEGYTDNTFRPEAQILRSESVTILNRALNRGILKKDLPSNIPHFTDLEEGHWAYEAIIEAATSHDYVRQETPYEKWSNVTWK